jgi:hypothetical protein
MPGLTPTHCGNNVESQGIGGAQGTANNPVVAMAIAFGNFVQAWNDADTALKDYAAQLCPDNCSQKVPRYPDPTYKDFNMKLHINSKGTWTCLFECKGEVQFECQKGPST